LCNAKQKIIDKLTCRHISETSYPKCARHLPAHLLHVTWPHTLFNITSQPREL